MLKKVVRNCVPMLKGDRNNQKHCIEFYCKIIDGICRNIPDKLTLRGIQQYHSILIELGPLCQDELKTIPEIASLASNLKRMFNQLKDQIQNREVTYSQLQEYINNQGLFLLIASKFCCKNLALEEAETKKITEHFYQQYEYISTLLLLSPCSKM